MQQTTRKQAPIATVDVTQLNTVRLAPHTDVNKAVSTPSFDVYFVG